MLFNTVSARRSPAKARATLQRVAAQAEVLKGVGGMQEGCACGAGNEWKGIRTGKQ